MKNFPTKLDSKTTSLRITVPENLDLALEGLIRKVLKEQPKTDDIYSFAADYFETLLKIRDKAGVKYMSSQICSFHNDEDAHEMIKLANSFPKLRTASDEIKTGQEPGKSVSSRKSPVIKKSEKVKTGSRVMGDKRKRPVERIKSSTNATNKIVPGFVKPVTEDVAKPSSREPEVKGDKLLTELEGNLQDLDEDEEFLKSDPIKELVERELMNKTNQNDINHDKGQSSTDMSEKLESEKPVDKVSKVIEPHENGKLKDELESKDNRKNEAVEGETSATGDELCGVVDALSVPRVLAKENETTTNQQEENKTEVNLNGSEKEKTEEGGQAIETAKPETEETVKVANESISEEPEQVIEGKLEDDKIVKQEEGNEKEPTPVVEDGTGEIKNIKDKPEDHTEDNKDKSEDDVEGNKDKPKEGAEDNQGKPKDAEDVKVTPAEKEVSDIITNKKEEEPPSEKPKVEVKEIEDTNITTEEAEKNTSDISQANSLSVPNVSKEELVKETEEKQKEETTNQSSVPEESSQQREEILHEKPSTDSKDSVEKQEDKEIKTELMTDEPIKTTEVDDAPTTEDKLEENEEGKIKTKENMEEELPKTEAISTSLDEGNETTKTNIEEPKEENETPSSDKEDVNQSEKPKNLEEDNVKDVAADDKTLKETKEEVIEKEETKVQSEPIIEKVVEELVTSKPEEETDVVSTEDEKKPDGVEKPTSETDQQEDEPEKSKIIVSTEKEPGGDVIEDESQTQVIVEEAKPTEEKPEPVEQNKTEDKPEEVKLDTEQISNPEDRVNVSETPTELKEDKNEESEESKEAETKEEPKKEFSSGSEQQAVEDTLNEKAVQEVQLEAEATEGNSKSDEVNETEKLSTQVDIKVDEEAMAVATPDKDDKDSVKDEGQKKPNEDESQTKTEETKQTGETENEKENNLSTENISPQQEDNNEEAKERETTSQQIETKETVEENKPEDANKDTVPSEEKTETHETITETTTESELCSVVDTQNLTKPDETANPEDGITIKTITTHYYDLLQVPATVTKEYKVHRTQDDSLTSHNLSTVGNTIIKSYQLVKELTSDGDNNNNNNPQTVTQDISLDIGSTNQTRETEIESDIQKDEIDDLNAIPTSGFHSELNLFTMHELFLDSERKLSSYQKEETKFSSLKDAKQSLEDTKTQTESPKTPPTNEEGKQEVEEIITKTVIPRIPEAVPDPPREVEEINRETNTEEQESVKDKKEDEKPDTNSSDDSTDGSNNGRSIDSDVPIISVEVRTVIETQILDDDEEASENTPKSSDYQTELTLTDGSNNVNVEVEATIQVPIETTDPEKKHNQNLTDQEKSREQQETKQQTDKEEPLPPPDETAIKSSKEDSEPGGSSTLRDGSSGESDSTTLTAVTEIKRFDSNKKNFERRSTQDLLTTQSLDSCKRPPLLKTRSLSVYRQGVTDFEIWNTIEKELEEAAIKIQSKYRGYTVRKRLRREDAVQITTEESSISTTPVEQESVDQDNFRATGEFHDSIVLSIHPR